MTENDAPEGGRTFKVVLKLEWRDDGGLRVWSDDVPGLVLSNADPRRVIADIAPALETILSHVLGRRVEARRLEPWPAGESPARRRLDASRSAFPGRRKTLEYAAVAVG